MTDGQVLEAALQERPEDIVTRLAYADWLEEQGDLASANRQRAQASAIPLLSWASPLRVRLSLQPDNVEARKQLAANLKAMGRHGQAGMQEMMADGGLRIKIGAMSRQMLIGASLSNWYAHGRPEGSKIIDLAPLLVSRHLTTVGAMGWTAYQVLRRNTRSLSLRGETDFAVLHRLINLTLHTCTTRAANYLRGLRDDLLVLDHNFCEPEPPAKPA